VNTVNEWYNQLVTNLYSGLKNVDIQKVRAKVKEATNGKVADDGSENDVSSVGIDEALKQLGILDSSGNFREGESVHLKLAKSSSSSSDFDTVKVEITYISGTTSASEEKDLNVDLRQLYLSIKEKVNVLKKKASYIRHSKARLDSSTQKGNNIIGSISAKFVTTYSKLSTLFKALDTYRKQFQKVADNLNTIDATITVKSGDDYLDFDTIKSNVKTALGSAEPDKARAIMKEYRKLAKTYKKISTINNKILKLSSTLDSFLSKMDAKLQKLTAKYKQVYDKLKSDLISGGSVDEDKLNLLSKAVGTGQLYERLRVAHAVQQVLKTIQDKLKDNLKSDTSESDFKTAISKLYTFSNTTIDGKDHIKSLSDDLKEIAQKIGSLEWDNYMQVDTGDGNKTKVKKDDFKSAVLSSVNVVKADEVDTALDGIATESKLDQIDTIRNYTLEENEKLSLNGVLNSGSEIADEYHKYSKALSFVKKLLTDVKKEINPKLKGHDEAFGGPKLEKTFARISNLIGKKLKKLDSVMSDAKKIKEKMASDPDSMELAEKYDKLVRTANSILKSLQKLEEKADRVSQKFGSKAEVIGNQTAKYYTFKSMADVYSLIKEALSDVIGTITNTDGELKKYEDIQSNLEDFIDAFETKITVEDWDIDSSGTIDSAEIKNVLGL